MRVDKDYLRSLVTNIGFTTNYKDGKPMAMTALSEIAHGAFHLSATSGTIVPERFDRCIGETVTTDMIIGQLFQLEGYLAKRILAKANAMGVKLETDGNTPDAVLELILTALLETK